MTVKRRQRPEAESGPVKLSCEECCQKIPYSPESGDYVAYFCGIACYQKWKDKRHSTDETKCQGNVFVDVDEDNPKIGD